MTNLFALDTKEQIVLELRHRREMYFKRMAFDSKCFEVESKGKKKSTFRVVA